MWGDIVKNSNKGGAGQMDQTDVTWIHKGKEVVNRSKAEDTVFVSCFYAMKLPQT